MDETKTKKWYQNGKGWIAILVSLFGIGSGGGAWLMKTWLSFKTMEALSAGEEARNAAIALRIAGQEKELAILNERVCVLMRATQEENKLALTLIPVECQPTVKETP